MITLLSFSALIVGILLLARKISPGPNFETGVLHAG